MDLTSANLLAVISVEIARPSFNFNYLPKFMVMKRRNLSNNMGLFNTYMMLSLLCMFFQGLRPGPPMFDASGVLMNPMINRAPCFTHIGVPARARDNISTFHVLGVNRVFNRS